MLINLMFFFAIALLILAFIFLVQKQQFARPAQSPMTRLSNVNYFGLFPTFGEFRKSLAISGHAAIMNRFSSSSKLALPYICRLSIFNLLFKPSTGPLLTSVMRLALTAA